MSQYLVTGTAGFIGFSLARRLLEQGIDVVGFDNVNDYYSVQLKRDRLRLLHEYDRFRFVEADLVDAAAIEEDAPLAAFTIINNELARYSTRLAKMEQVVVLNKMDIPDARLRAEAFLSAAPEKKCFCVSAAANQEVEALKKYLFAVLSQRSREGAD